ncbi:MAG: hypothetical protein CMP10_19140 [Zetaproteobacteria bacterium]|nr:hypothetical protein [Pseudobdellovibrionaceae bacterium]
MYKLQIFFYAIFISASSTSMAKQQEIVGAIKSITGGALILRNPQKVTNPRLKRQAKKRGFAIKSVDGLHYQSYEAWLGTKIKMGDNIFADRGEVEVVLDDGYHIKLAQGTRIKISPRLTKWLDGKWINLLIGKMRVSSFKRELVKNDRRLPVVEFRTSSMVIGVEGTDFAVNQGYSRSKILTLQGKVKARRVSPQAQKVYLKAVKAFELNDQRGLIQASQRLQQLPKRKFITVDANQVVDSETFRSSKKSALARPLMARSLERRDVMLFDDLQTRFGHSDDDPLAKLISYYRSQQLNSFHPWFVSAGAMKRGFAMPDYWENLKKAPIITNPGGVLAIGYTFAEIFELDLSFSYTRWAIRTWSNARMGHCGIVSEGYSSAAIGLGVFHQLGQWQLGSKISLQSETNVSVDYDTVNNASELQSVFYRIGEGGWAMLHISGRYVFHPRLSLQLDLAGGKTSVEAKNFLPAFSDDDLNQWSKVQASVGNALLSLSYRFAI